MRRELPFKRLLLLYQELRQLLLALSPQQHKQLLPQMLRLTMLLQHEGRG